MAEGVGFEPTVRLPVLLISSQMPLTTQPPFQPLDDIGFNAGFHIRQFVFSIPEFHTIRMNVTPADESEARW